MSDPRGSASSRGYDARWRKARAAFLREHPVCRICAREGKVSPARVVDHIRPHRGDMELFWDRANWQPLCKPCHDRVKQSEEARGYSNEIGEDGWPLDPKHPANRRQQSRE